MKPAWSWIPALCLFSPLGCGKAEGPPREPVRGTVTVNGEALAHATVCFIPAGETGGTRASDTTAADGTYRLALPAGAYRVTVSKWLRPDGSLPPADDPDLMSSDARETIPRQYSDADQTTLTRTVPQGGGTLDLPLQVPRKSGR